MIHSENYSSLFEERQFNQEKSFISVNREFYDIADWMRLSSALAKKLSDG